MQHQDVDNWVLINCTATNMTQSLHQGSSNLSNYSASVARASSMQGGGQTLFKSSFVPNAEQPPSKRQEDVVVKNEAKAHGKQLDQNALVLDYYFREKRTLDLEG